jgi:hypothetical protein
MVAACVVSEVIAACLLGDTGQVSAQSDWPDSEERQHPAG